MLKEETNLMFPYLNLLKTTIKGEIKKKMKIDTDPLMQLVDDVYMEMVSLEARIELIKRDLLKIKEQIELDNELFKLNG